MPLNKTSTLNNPLPRSPLRTGQTTAYAANDDGDRQKGIAKLYTVLTAGQFTSTTAVNVPAYAAATISFDETDGTFTVLDSANGLALVKTADVVVIKGSTSNDGTYTVASGANAASFTTTEALVDEAAGAWITIAKQASQSNNCVQDLETGLMWMRYGSYSPAKLGAASDGKLLWTATAITIHAANNDLQMIAGGKGSATVKIVGGAGEVLRYWPGYTYSFTAFTNAVNKLFGFKCVSVTVNGADLDIVLATGNQTCIAEAAGVNGAINLSCNGIFGFANSANQAAVGGYSDWRVSNLFEMFGLWVMALGKGAPDDTAFLSFPAAQGPLWGSTTLPSSAASSPIIIVNFANIITSVAKNNPYAYTMLVRGGV